MKTPLFLSLSLLAPSLVSGATIAQSSDQFSGIQGNGNWYYGYYDRSADLGGSGDGVYQTAEFTEFLGGAGAGAWGDTNHWNSTTWDYNPPGASNGNPPWTNIGAGNTHPNDNNPGPEHHTVRRWVSGVTGEVNISGLFNNVSASGDGTVGQVWVNGSLLSANTTDGSSANFNHDVYVTPGSTIDFVVTPNNPADDGSDGTNFQATMTMSSIADSVVTFLAPKARAAGSTATTTGRPTSRERATVSSKPPSSPNSSAVLELARGATRTTGMGRHGISIRSARATEIPRGRRSRQAPPTPPITTRVLSTGRSSAGSAM
ncbi:MAG: hypothetical protein R3F11_10910 [Verrucomicrobiales bacterium]